MMIPDIHLHRNHHHQVLYHYHHRQCNAPEVHVCEPCLEFSVQWLYSIIQAECLSDILQ
jgi:hypothetical protein